MDSFDVCLSCVGCQPENQLRFDFNRWLISRDCGGEEWLREVYVRLYKSKIKYNAVSVAWEDLDRSFQSASGSCIFDVSVRLSSGETRYVIRPTNMQDVVQPRSASTLTLPIGQVVHQPLRAVTLSTLLSSPTLLQECGLSSEIKGTLYVPEMDEYKKGSGEEGGGGVSFSAGCTLHSELDRNQPYSVEVYMYRSYEYPHAKCLALVQTSEGTTATLVEMGKTQTLQFVKKGKLCHWKIQSFDATKVSGQEAALTGCDEATDMLIYFIPVMEDHPVLEQVVRVSKYKSKCKSKSKNPCHESLHVRSIQFGRHDMEMTDEDFKEKVKSKYPLKRIPSLPIRCFHRGGLLFQETRPLTREDAIAVSRYLQGKYMDTQLTTVWAFSIQARERSRILPIFHRPDGILFLPKTFNSEYTEYAAQHQQKCVICMVSPINRVLLGCGHMCLCASCGMKWTTTCPLCRQPIKNCVPEVRVDKSSLLIIPQGVE
jgi:hypothetical protein